MEWNDAIFQQWGQIMGKMHRLTKSYQARDSSVRRADWNKRQLFLAGLNLGAQDGRVLELWNNLLDEFNSLPTDKDSYGLVHNDLHYNNILLHDSQIVVIDFDACAYNWFACDIAIALHEALSTVPYSERNTFAVRLLKNFFSGYNLENRLTGFWINQLPNFLKYRQIYTYLFLMNIWNHNTLTTSQREFLSTRKRLIENEVPCIKISLSDLNNC